MVADAPPGRAMFGRDASSVFGSVPRRVGWLILLMSFSSLATGYFWVATSAYLPQIGVSSGSVGLLLAINGVVFILVAIPLGVLADRVGRKQILILGVMGMPPALLIYAMTSEVAFLMLASVIAGAAEGAFMTTWNALIADMASGEGRKEAFTLSFIVTAAGAGAGYALPYTFPFIAGLGGWTVTRVHEVFFVIIALVALITPLSLARLLREYRESPGERMALRKGRNLGPMLKFSALNSIIGLGAGFIIPLIPTWLFLRYGVADNLSGPLLALASLTMGFASIASTGLARRFGTVKAIALCQGSSTVFMLALAFAPDPATAGGLYVVRAMLMNMSNPLSDSFLMGIVTKEERGLASAINSIVWRLPNSVTTVVGGFLLGMGLYAEPFYLATLFYAISVALFFLIFRGMEPGD
ncbi:MAG: MFS transporter [Methanomassiliicoccus sp.]|nr:MFS transporter [Methanomassiliicoccus sp.]